MASRLAKPLSELRPRYDVVVVGSGYGGGVAACRLSRCGRSVAVLERGKEYLPGEFPSGPLEATRALQMTGRKTSLGPPDALFDLRLGEGIHVLQGCGLGGTSLINANVCLVPDERVFDSPVWPSSVVNDRLLADGYVRARAMLRPRPQPEWRALTKVKAFDAAASVLGHSLVPAPLHVAFESGENAAGVSQPACTSCGDCCGGCNVGAKVTVANSYLADAAAHGAEVFTHVRVWTVQKAADGWRIVFTVVGADGTAGTREIDAEIVVLAAGTLGTTEILFQSAADGLAVSEHLGQHFTSNGDAIALAYNNILPVNGIGTGQHTDLKVPLVGAAVSSLLDMRRTDDVREGLAIVECALPSSLAALLPALLASGSAAFGKDDTHTLAGELAEISRSAKSLVAGAYTGAVHNTQTFLAVGHDAGDGRMVMAGERIVVEWPGAAKQDVFQRIETVLKQAAFATGGTYLRNPASERLLGGNLLTVHPLGGCVAASSRNQGVVNHKGQVFDRDAAEPDAVHDGLYVCDGSVVPTSLGVHPLLTITALAERAMIHLAHDRGWEMDDGPTPRRTDHASGVAAPSTPPRKGWRRWLSR